MWRWVPWCGLLAGGGCGRWSGIWRRWPGPGILGAPTGVGWTRWRGPSGAVGRSVGRVVAAVVPVALCLSGCQRGVVVGVIRWVRVPFFFLAVGVGGGRPNLFRGGPALWLGGAGDCWCECRRCGFGMAWVVVEVA